MFTVTFYSYKGGVGRTSALVNVAHRLAMHGRRVFVVDFDLEAPGLDSYGLTSGHAPTRGLLEYITEFTTTGSAPDLELFVQKSNLPGLEDRLFFMPGGRKDDAYKVSLARLDWKFLYKERKGFLFVENLRAAIQDRFRPDYLLIDARTGLTDISGICTLQLPDLVVLLFSLTEQSLSGIRSVLYSIKHNRIDRDILTMLVASPVPDLSAAGEIRASRLEHAKAVLGASPDEILPYDPSLALGESIVGIRSPLPISESLTKAYESLTLRLINANASDILTQLGTATRFRNEANLEAAESEYQRIVATFPNNVLAWTEFGKLERLRGRPTQAAEYFEKAYAIDPLDRNVLAQLSLTLAKIDEARSERFFREYLRISDDAAQIMSVSHSLRLAGLPAVALEGLIRVTMITPTSLNAFTTTGDVQMQLRRYEDALRSYRRAVEIDPNNLAAVYNSGAVMQQLRDPDARNYFERAISIFEQIKRPVENPALANMEEAISRAYETLGFVPRAVELLESALRRARECPPNLLLFTSTRYMYVTPQQFIDDVSHRITVIRKTHPELPFNS